MKVDLLMWVGSTYYPTIESYLYETQHLGACKRVARIPKNIEVGKSRCFLIHDNDGNPAIFAYYVIKRIECIVKDGFELSKELEKRGVKPISIRSVINNEPKRGCGYRFHVGAFYVTSYELALEDLLKVQDLAKRKELLGEIHVLNPYIPYNGGFFRNYKLIDGDILLKTKDVNLALRKAKEG
jgi:hypothetical protein